MLTWFANIANMTIVYCHFPDIKHKLKKSVCLFFRSSTNKRYALPTIFTCDTICEFSNKVRYLGVMQSSSIKTTIDVKKQTRTFYERANLFICNYRHCTDKVKCYLFQSYCTNMSAVHNTLLNEGQTAQAEEKL